MENLDDDFISIKRCVVTEWLPIIGTHGFGLYSVLLSGAEKYQVCDGLSINDLAVFLQLTSNTVIRYSFLLEKCGLIRIKHGKKGNINTYVLLEPPHVSYELLVELRLFFEKKQGSKDWQGFYNQILKRIDLWHPLVPKYEIAKNCPNCRKMTMVEGWKIMYNWPVECEDCHQTSLVKTWLELYLGQVN